MVKGITMAKSRVKLFVGDEQQFLGLASMAVASDDVMVADIEDVQAEAFNALREACFNGDSVKLTVEAESGRMKRFSELVVIERMSGPSLSGALPAIQFSRATR